MSNAILSISARVFSVLDDVTPTTSTVDQAQLRERRCRFVRTHGRGVRFQAVRLRRDIYHGVRVKRWINPLRFGVSQRVVFRLMQYSLENIGAKKLNLRRGWCHGIRRGAIFPWWNRMKETDLLLNSLVGRARSKKETILLVNCVVNVEDAFILTTYFLSLISLSFGMILATGEHCVKNVIRKHLPLDHDGIINVLKLSLRPS